MTGAVRALDALALGEVMLRLDPGEGRIRTSRHFQVWEGGGEYNVARSLRRCFALRTGIVTALVDNEIGRLLEDLILQGGVDTSFIRWVPGDGIGRSARNGLNFVERGFGIRAPRGVSDRANTAASKLRSGEIDWDAIFAAGVCWLHTGGVFAALSDTTADVVHEAMIAARRHGVTVSYDPNYRPSLWQGRGGAHRAREIDLRLAQHADVVVGALSLAGKHPGDTRITADGIPDALAEIAALLPQAKVLATTVRTVVSAGVHDWSAAAWSPGTGFVAGPRMYGLQVLDRIGSGDAFAAGLVYGLLTGTDLERALAYGTIHGALAMTTPGDTSMATLAEIEALLTDPHTDVER